MAAPKIKAYNSFLRAVKAARGITHKEAQQAYRGMSARLGRAPKPTDITAHPRITREEAVKAAAAVKAASRRAARTARAEERKAEAARARKTPAKQPAEKPTRAKRKTAEKVEAGGGGGADRGGGAGGGRDREREFFEDYYAGFDDEAWYDFEDPLEDTGESAE